MPSLSTTGAYTRADYDRLPEGFPAQLVNGWLVKEEAPAYGHQGVAIRLHRRLCELVGEGRVFIAPIDVPVDDRNVYQPDVVVHREKVSWACRHAEIPVLVIEVLSPMSARRDRARKTPRLVAAGVEEVWLVDPSAGTVEVVAPDGRRVASGDEPIAPRAVVGFEVVPRVPFTPPQAGASSGYFTVVGTPPLARTLRTDRSRTPAPSRATGSSRPPSARCERRSSRPAAVPLDALDLLFLTRYRVPSLRGWTFPVASVRIAVGTRHPGRGAPAPSG